MIIIYVEFNDVKKLPEDFSGKKYIRKLIKENNIISFFFFFFNFKLNFKDLNIFDSTITINDRNIKKPNNPVVTIISK